ncbi:unnamed protein product [Darwinula stevensoni]|uniref:Uncharacterized protein n=1 Tax=Darwinula stevensoni TaxID=69355 RepID=A0A7R8WYK2_9CRUS|nr:unnamed protein product [Darwinula stevensoni]CAG0879501.1 unnamed protein product [Darwinula stevensoni]
MKFVVLELRELVAELLKELDPFLKQCMALVEQKWREVSLSFAVSEERESSLQVHPAAGPYATPKLNKLVDTAFRKRLPSPEVGITTFMSSVKDLLEEA